MRFLGLVLSILLTFSAYLFAEEESFVYDDHDKRDPFWRLVSPSGAILSLDNDLQITDMVLEGIIQDPGGNNLAIINSVVVGPNDKIGLFVVSEVGKDKVFLVKGQESYVLKLKKEE